MPITIPPELKKVTPYVRRAEELDRDKENPESRVMAFYCRQYAVQSGIPLASSTTGKQCLGEILAGLERDKKAMTVFSKDESKLICRRFADKIFTKADAEDRAAAATKATAKTYYAAASFFEVLQQFYSEPKTEEQEEEEQKVIYCKWRATEILKAIKEGRKPEPPEGLEGGTEEEDGDSEVKSLTEDGGVEAEDAPEAPEEEEKEEDKANPQFSSLEDQKDETDDFSVHEPQDDEGTEVGLGPPPAYPGSGVSDLPNVEENGPDEVFVPSPEPEEEPPRPPPFDTSRPPMTYSPPPVPPPMPPPKPAPTPEKKKSGLFGFGGGNSKRTKSRLSKSQFDDATELTKFALAALKKKDSETAEQRLQQALDILRS